MPFTAPDLTAAVKTATTNNKWSPNDAKGAQEWFVNFLQAVYNAPAGTVINVMDRKADDLWHEFLNDPGYDAYCMKCFGHVLKHIENPPRRKATAAELAAVKPYYPKWPIPDSMVGCISAPGG